jgi:hypothetical protein
MQQVTEEFNDAVRSGGAPLVTVTVGDTTLDVVEGTVTLDATATTRGSCALTLAVSQDDLEFGGLIPDEPDDLLAPYGNEIIISRGMLINDEPEMVQLGIFRIDEVEVTETNDGQVQLSVSGMDRSIALIDAVFERAGQISSPNPAQQTIAWQALVLLAYAGYGPSLRVSDTILTAPNTKIPMLGWEAGDDRWDFLLGLAEAVNGSELFFDQDGVLTMIDRVGQEQPPAVWEFVEGADATLLGVGKRWSREDAVNRVVVEGQAAGGDNDPVYGEAVDLNPDSPTFYSAQPGRFGKKTMVWSSEWVQFKNQADAVAARILRQNIGTHQEISFDSLVHPAIEPNDVVTVSRPQLGINEDHIIESVTIPLALEGTMSCTTRRFQITGDSTPPPPVVVPSGDLARVIADTVTATDASTRNYKAGGTAPTLPPAGMSLKWDAVVNAVANTSPTAPGEWDQILNETTGPDPVYRTGYCEITAPPTETAGRRNELMSSNDARGGMTVGSIYYIEWEVYIPSTMVIPEDDDGYSTINQMKGRNDLNADSHYTGGFGIRTDEQFEVRIRGGNYVGPGNNYQSMEDHVFGDLVRDRYHKIGYHVRWAKDATGWARVYLDGALRYAKGNGTGANFPTMSEYSNGINFRLGWYPQRVGPTSAVMRIRNVRIYQ